MHLHIVSNHLNPLYQNHINNFQMRINILINCHNSNKYICVNPIQFTTMILNMKNGKDCSLSIVIKLIDFKMNASKQNVACELKAEANANVPHEAYNVVSICDVLNQTMEEFSLTFLQLTSKCVCISYSFYYEYWCKQSRSLLGSLSTKAKEGGTWNELRPFNRSWVNRNKKASIIIQMSFSKKLSFMLGFQKTSHFKFQ